MSSRVDFFFRQRVTEAELDRAFDLLEQADRDLAADLGVFGLISGAVPAPHGPIADLTIDLTGPARAYDRLGQRVFFGTGQRVDCSVDLTGLPTEVSAAGHERWVGVFLRFTRLLSDPRTDGNSQQVFFRRDESFEIVVRQGPEAPAGSAPHVALFEDELLVCEVRREPGQRQITAADIDISRRQLFVSAQAQNTGVSSAGWTAISSLVSTVQAAFDSVDQALAEHFSGAARRHRAQDIDYPPRQFVTATHVEGALNQTLDELTGSGGAARVGAAGVGGTPNALPPGTAQSHAAALLGFVNAHAGATSGAHHATAIAATPHQYVAAGNVQSQLQELVTRLLEATEGSSGADRIGSAAAAGALQSLAAGTVRSQTVELLAAINNTLQLFQADHHQAGTAAGQHKTVRQRITGRDQVLCWECMAGDVAIGFRLYFQVAGFAFTTNARGTATGWSKDVTNRHAMMLFFGTRGLDVLIQPASAPATFELFTERYRVELREIGS